MGTEQEPGTWIRNRTVRVDVEPSTYMWAFECSSLDLDQLAPRFPKLRDWMAGDWIPTLERLRGGLATGILMVAANAGAAIICAISPRQDHDRPHGRQLLKRMGSPKRKAGGEQLQLFLVADWSHEGNETRQLGVALGYTRLIPPRATAVTPWDFNRDLGQLRRPRAPCNMTPTPTTARPSPTFSRSLMGGKEVLR